MVNIGTSCLCRNNNCSLQEHNILFADCHLKLETEESELLRVCGDVGQFDNGGHMIDPGLLAGVSTEQAYLQLADGADVVSEARPPATQLLSTARVEHGL